MPIDIMGQDRNRGIGKVQMSFPMSGAGRGWKSWSTPESYFDRAAVKCAKIDRAINAGWGGDWIRVSGQ